MDGSIRLAILGAAALGCFALLLLAPHSPTPWADIAVGIVAGFVFLGPLSLVVLRPALAALGTPTARALGIGLVAAPTSVVFDDATSLPSQFATIGNSPEAPVAFAVHVATLVLVASVLTLAGWLRLRALERAPAAALALGLAVVGILEDGPLVLALAGSQLAALLLVFHAEAGRTGVLAILGALALAIGGILLVALISGGRWFPPRVVMSGPTFGAVVAGLVLFVMVVPAAIVLRRRLSA